MNKTLKFGLPVVAILGTLSWLAVGGIQQSASYYKEIAELQKMGQNGVDKRLRVGGDVEANSIHREGADVHFVLVQDKDGVKRKLNVIYNGADPLPDTFKDNAPCQALVEGTLGSDQVFHAKKLQAKCASKYEAKPGAPTTRSS